MSRVAMVTGASRGIGAATARVLAEDGFRVVVNYRSSAAEADEVVAAITAAGGEAVAIRADVTLADDVAAMFGETGSVDAAYVGSTMGPEQVAEEEGFHVLAWVGDHFQIPTVGIAVDATRNPIDSPPLQALVRANQRALKTMADQPDLAIRYIASFFNRMTNQEVQRYYERYIQPYYTSDGRVHLDVARHAVDAVAAELGVASVPADAIYAPALGMDEAKSHGVA
jgi:NAD(P)-dependent dehydrogenase (short-subunit alcohol dehydrogenase family)